MAVNTLAYLSQAQPYKSGTVPDPMAMLSDIQTLKQKEQATELGEKELSDYEEDRQRKWQLEKAEAGRAAAKEADDKITRHLDIRKNAMDWAEKLLPHLNYEDYPTFYQEAIANGIDEQALAHPKDIKSPEDFNAWRIDTEGDIRKGRELLGKDTEAVSQIRRWRDEQQAGPTESFLEFKVREKKALEEDKLPSADVQMYNLWKEENPEGSVSDFLSLSQTDRQTALKKNVPYLAEVLDISEKEAADLLIRGKGETDQTIYRKLFAYAYSEEKDVEIATDVANKAFEVIVGKPYKKKTSAGEDMEKSLQGMQPGRYRSKESGNEVEWDGQRIIRVIGKTE